MDSVGYWRTVAADRFPVPTDRSLEDLTLDLAAMLGSPDPRERDEIAVATLTAWIGRGVYDDLLAGLGDGMAEGLANGLGEVDTDSVFRRSYSALVLVACLDRDSARRLLTRDTVLAWGDRILTWTVRERDLRARVPGRGRALAIAHGADALAALARSTHLGVHELTVLLDVVADRLELATTPFVDGEPDRLALAVLDVLRRGLVPLAVVEPWLMRLAGLATPPPAAPDDDARVGNTEAVLRAMHLQVAFSPAPPPERADLLLALARALKQSNGALLNPSTPDPARGDP